MTRPSHLNSTVALGVVLWLGLLHSSLPVLAAQLEVKPVELPVVELEPKPIQLGLATPLTGAKSAIPHPAPTPPPIITTRPSFTDSWLTVPQGSFQAENGVTYTKVSRTVQNVQLPESLLKLGLTDNTEFRFSVPNYTWAQAGHADTISNNFGDMSVGFSHHRSLPGKVDVTIIPFVNIPTGANNVSSNSLDPQLRLVAAHYLNPKLVFASQLDTRWHTGQGQPKVVLNPTGIAYYAFTGKLTGFLEYGGFIPNTGSSQQYIQSGVLYLLTQRQQVDARIAVGLNKASSDLIVGVGYSFRVDGLFGSSKQYATFPLSKKP